jgi:hypothetical protein
MPVRASADRRVSAWQRYLEQQDGPALADELPEIVFSRAAIGTGASMWLEAAGFLELTDREWDVARHCEIRAAGLGLSLQEFVAAVGLGVLDGALERSDR